MTNVPDQQKLIQEVYETAQDYLPRLIDGLVVTAEELRLGQTQPAFERIPLLLDGLDWNLQVLQSFSELGEDQSGELTALTVSLKSNLSQINAFLEKQDYVSAADLLEYEIAEDLGKWLKITREQVVES